MTEASASLPPDDAAAAPTATPGRILAAARLARGMTVTEVAMRLKFSPRQLEALEADRYDLLAGPAFARGMIRSYAKLLGVDADPLIAVLRAQLTRPGPTMMPMPALGVPFPRASKPGSFVYVGLSALLVVAMAGVLVEWLLRPEPGPASASATGAPPAPLTAPSASVAPVVESVPPATTEAPPAATPKPVPAAAEPQRVRTAEKRIELVFDRESWVEVRDADGRVLFSQLNPPGSRRQVAGDGPFSLVIGNAAGVKVRYNDTDVDLKPYTRTDVARLTLE